MDFLNQGMLFLLDSFHTLLGSYGLAIIALTVVIRLVLWPLNTAQAKSMKAMQTLQPKLKAIQDQYKDNPAQMQKELMRIYSEDKINPLAGCLPMLIQLPLFIALYGALMDPSFMMRAGNESFLFIDRLHHTIKSSGGEPMDNQFSVEARDRFVTKGNFTVKLTGQPMGQQVRLQDLRITDPAKILTIEPRPLIPGEPVRFTLFQSDLGYSDAYMKRVESVTVPVSDENSRELEKVTLRPTEKGNALTAELPTTQAHTTYHWDVIAMIALYGVLTWAYQLTMSAMTPAADNPVQKMMSKWMPLMFTGLMFVIPIPAGVLLYLLTTMVMMLLQNVLIMRQDDKPGNGIKRPDQQVVTIAPDKA